jgi:DNA replication protein DnaC
MKKNTDTAALDAALRAHLRALMMPGVARKLDELLRHAEDEHASYQQLLVDVLAAEIQSREASSVNLRLAAAHFPERKTIGDFDAKAVGVEAALVAQLASCAFVDRGDNVAILGPVGTGKTHLAIALGIEACRRRKRVVFVRAADLVRELIESRDQRELGRLHRRLQRAEVLIIDELGFVPFDRVGGELLFNLFSERHRRRSIVVTSNLAFSEWSHVLGGDEKLTAALLDRLAETATVITTNGKSFRTQKRTAAAKAA